MRHRWLRAEWPLSIRTFAVRLKTVPFSATSNQGFVIDRVRDRSIEARFVERTEFTETVVDPFGAETLLPRLQFVQCSFMVYDDFPQLELIDCPRSAHALLSKFSELTQFSMAVEQVQVDVLSWVRRFRRLAGVRTSIEAIHISRLEVERGVQAAIVLRGSADIGEALDKMTRGRSFCLQKVGIKVLEKEPVSVVLTSAGVATLDASAPREFAPALREALSSAAKVLRHHNDV